VSERTVTCPRCGQQVAVPTTGEKVRCPGCGQKFRFDSAQSPEGGPQPTPERPAEEEPDQREASEPGADTIACPRCGQRVAVPRTGEKVQCPGCGQKFRYEVKAEEASPPRDRAPLPPPLPFGPSEEPETSETEDIEEVAAEAAPEPPEAPVEPVVEPPRVVAAPPASVANELRTLWPALTALVERVYEDGKASEGDRVRFSEEARRAAELVEAYVPAGDQTVREFIFSVLPEMTLDEVIALSLEDFRHLRETFAEARELLERSLPAPPGVERRPPAPAQPPAPVVPRPRPVVSTPAAVALTVFFGLVVVLILNLPEIKKRLDALRPPPTRKITIVHEVEKPRAASASTRDESVEARPIVEEPAPEEQTPRPRQTKPPVEVEAPVVEGGERQPPKTSTPPPKPTTEVTVVEKPVRVPSRWKPRADGWIVAFDGSRPDGLDADPGAWTVEKGLLIGRAAGSTLAPMLQASWTDYTLDVELQLGRQGEAVVAHGSLVVVLSDKAVRLLNVGRVLDEVPRGLARGKWYRVVLEVGGSRAVVRINDKQALVSTAFDGSPGAPTVGARGGAVAFRSVRVKLQPTDPDYRAVVLGEGYVRPPGTAPTTPTEAARPGPGTYRLFNGRDLSGWSRVGDWRVAAGILTGASSSARPATLIAGSPQWADYTLGLRFRIVRQTAVPRDDEYALVIFRARDERNFHCVRFAVEGIYEIGYYRNGRFRETSRARFGLGSRSKFNLWHSLRLTVRGGKLTMSIDGVGGMPPWPITTFANGAVGVGVTGGQAAFRDISVKVYR